MRFMACRTRVKNRGVPPEEFLSELVQWAQKADERLFMSNANVDIYTHTKAFLGPYSSLRHRKAVMLEVLRVLAGFESSWDSQCGVDTTNPTSVHPETEEAGLWQVSMNAIAFGEDLKQLVKARIGSTNYRDGRKFQAATKCDRTFATEFIVRLLRHTVKHNGPAKRVTTNSTRDSIYPWLSRDAVSEFFALLG